MFTYAVFQQVIQIYSEIVLYFNSFISFPDQKILMVFQYWPVVSKVKL